MSSPVDVAYEGAQRAFRSPTLALLHRRHAPLVVTLLGQLFTPERQGVPVADAHAEADEALAHLRAAGHADLPEGAARDLCRQWVAEGWLVRQVVDARSVRSGEQPGEEYRLTAHAVEALEVAARAGGPRSRVTRSRVRSLLEAVERLADDVEPDVAARRARVRGEIARLSAELERLEAGQVEPADDEQLLEEAEHVLFLVRELPADFTRVAESIRALQRRVVLSLRQDDRPTGEVLAEYLEQAEHLLEQTSEGRAFAGALRLLGDAERLGTLARSLESVLQHPFAQRLAPAQRAELRGLTRQIEQGLEDVLTAQRRASHVIATQVRHHDPLRDRQVDDLLRDAVAALAAWMPGTRSGQPVEALRRLPRAEVGRLRETLHDLRPPVAPEPLAEWDEDGTDGVSLADARRWGGPQYEALLEHARSLRGADAVDVGAVFEAGPQDLRRPVDLVGLLELARPAEDAAGGAEVSVVTAVRPDGSRRRFAFERAVLQVQEQGDADGGVPAAGSAQDEGERA
ncbi:DUF3375 domain-containing protein [Xylanimonas oleitrophica]|uniref:DUF3375 domain-containing protein n=1 Tax=Xylanimonas oleitrophica TaxID=2607479 RepID=A0A2W5WPY0_9MICO|nr:DUF3375 domain-containing protein [Xylanimonas oleitrophica]PZR53639.1 DUF3375 domain-containing protein [Xylanimonas oleitrophica]